VLTVHTVTQLLGQVQTAMKQETPNCLDLKAIEKVDSAGLALLIEIMRLCHTNNCHIKVINASEQLRHLAMAHDVEDFLCE
jgi:anti-anti-sigma factor